MFLVEKLVKLIEKILTKEFKFLRNAVEDLNIGSAVINFF